MAVMTTVEGTRSFPPGEHGRDQYRKSRGRRRWEYRRGSQAHGAGWLRWGGGKASVDLVQRHHSGATRLAISRLASVDQLRSPRPPSARPPTPPGIRWPLPDHQACTQPHMRLHTWSSSAPVRRHHRTVDARATGSSSTPIAWPTWWSRGNRAESTLDEIGGFRRPHRDRQRACPASRRTAEPPFGERAHGQQPLVGI